MPIDAKEFASRLRRSALPYWGMDVVRGAEQIIIEELSKKRTLEGTIQENGQDIDWTSIFHEAVSNRNVKAVVFARNKMYENEEKLRKIDELKNNLSVKVNFSDEMTGGARNVFYKEKGLWVIQIAKVYEDELKKVLDSAAVEKVMDSTAMIARYLYHEIIHIVESQLFEKGESPQNTELLIDEVCSMLMFHKAR